MKYSFGKFPISPIINITPFSKCSDKLGNVYIVTKNLEYKELIKSPLTNPKEFLKLNETQYKLYLKLCNYELDNSNRG